MSYMPPLQTTSLPADAVEVGRIADAWGIKGWFKVYAFSSAPEALFAAKSWFLQPAEKVPSNSVERSSCLSSKQLSRRYDRGNFT
ncbi:hypothetical protein J4711_14835 [Staphylococcus epidermidis]|nr:hypothetical protein [Staphylococcus epidermidis]